MLIRFAVENFLSFRDRVEFSMVAGNTLEHPDHVLDIGSGSDDKLLKTGVIYGANAAGKSNLIKALRFAQEFIVFRPGNEERDSVTPFSLDPNSKSAATQFEFEFMCSSGTYIYSFELSDNGVLAESLKIVDSANETTIYARETDESGKSDVMLLEPQTTDNRDLRILEFTKEILESNELYLSKLMDNKITYLRDVYDWFRQTLKVILPDGLSTLMTKVYLSEEEYVRNSRDIIKLFDLGIEDVSLKDVGKETSAEEKEDLYRRHGEDQRNVALHFPIVGLYMFLRSDRQVHMKRLMTMRTTRADDGVEFFDMRQESDGTQRLIELSWALISLLSEAGNTVLFVDEIDLRLHPHITKNILEIFLANSVNRPSQLIATTHEAGLLDLDLLRKDEIWFIEKDREGNSDLYSLEEFVPQYDRDIESGYLQGRFGAIPIVPSYNVLEWAK